MTPWRTAWGGPAGSARLRAEIDDFRVDEVLGFEPDGSGEHVLLQMRKRGANTADMARAVARFAGVRPKAVGVSGHKDRHASTAQWLSVHLPGRDDPDWSGLDCTQWVVERALRHGRRLRRGTHRANRFILRLRDFRGDAARLAERVQAVREGGFPNYFGPQRFGRGGENVQRARRMIAAESPPPRGPRGLYLSAARSWLFNLVLERRVGERSWCDPYPGDALMLAGSRSMFMAEAGDPELAGRLQALDLHVTGPLWGIAGRAPLSADMEARERAWLAAETDLLGGLERLGMRADRRPLRATATDFDWSLDGDTLELGFALESGVFATALLFELVDTAER